MFPALLLATLAHADLLPPGGREPCTVEARCNGDEEGKTCRDNPTTHPCAEDIGDGWQRRCRTPTRGPDVSWVYCRPVAPVTPVTPDAPVTPVAPVPPVPPAGDSNGCDAGGVGGMGLLAWLPVLGLLRRRRISAR